MRRMLPLLVLFLALTPRAFADVCRPAGATPFEKSRLTADGSAVSFATTAPLVAEDTNGTLDVYIQDLRTGAVRLISVDAASRSGAPDVSDDGRYVAFVSHDPAAHVYVRDLVDAKTERLAPGSRPSISPDGSLVAFQSPAALAPEDTNGLPDIYVFDREDGTTTLASVGPDGQLGDNLGSFAPSISANGKVVFHSTASWVPIGDDLRTFLKDGIAYDRNIFVRDIHAGTTSLVSSGLGGVPHDGLSMFPAISADGRSVAFTSSATNLVEGDTNNRPDVKGIYQPDVFVRDLDAGVTKRVSVASDGTQADGLGSSGPGISADGSVVAFETDATTLASGDGNGALDVVVRSAHGTVRASSDADGSAAPAAGALSFGSVAADVSADGRSVAFVSSSPGLLGHQNDGTPYVFGVFVRSLESGELAGPFGVGCRPAPHTDGDGAAPLALGAMGLPLLAAGRLRRVAPLALSVLLLLVAVPAGAHHYKPIQPGGAVLRDGPIGVASLNFAFRDRTTGEHYVGTAGHAVREFALGSRVANDAAGEFGTLVYYREGLFEFSNQDYALIKVDADKADLVDPSVRLWGGPTAVARFEDLLPGLPTYQYGQGAYFRLTEATRPKPGLLSRGMEDDWGYVGWASELRHGFGGDSGSPILYGPDGKALAVTILFAAAAFGEPAVQMGPTMDLVLQELNLAGFDLELATAPFDPAMGAASAAVHCAAQPIDEGAENAGCVRPSTDG